MFVPRKVASEILKKHRTLVKKCILNNSKFESNTFFNNTKKARIKDKSFTKYLQQKT